MTGTVYLQVISGLASRTRVVLAGVAYSKASGKKLVIDWAKKDDSQKSKRFDVSLEELWTGPYQVHDSGRVWYASSGLRLRNEQIPAALERDGDVRIRSDSSQVFGRWFDPKQGRFMVDGTMNPTPLLQHRIDSLSALLDGGPAIGCHVRLENARPTAPTAEWYIDRIESLPPWKIYLATDAQLVADQFRDYYGDRVVTADRVYDPPYDRDSIITCAAELHVLAKCDWVLGCCGSTYSELVAMMMGAEKIGSHRKAEPYLRGGAYEDAWNPRDEIRLQVAVEYA